jgi:hypothetical protein
MADTTRAREDFAYEVIVPFEECLARTVRHYTDAAQADTPAAAPGPRAPRPRPKLRSSTMPPVNVDRDQFGR